MAPAGMLAAVLSPLRRALPTTAVAVACRLAAAGRPRGHDRPHPATDRER